MTGTRILQPGEPAPWFRQQSTSNPNYAFDTVGGRYVVLCFHHSAGDAAGREMLRIVEERRTLFDDDTVAFFGVSTDPADETEQRVKPMLPGVRYFWDFDRKISQLYGVSGPQGDRRVWMVMDPTLRIRAVFQSEGGAEWRKVADYLASLPPVAEHPGVPVHAPVLVVIDEKPDSGQERAVFHREWVVPHFCHEEPSFFVPGDIDGIAGKRLGSDQLDVEFAVDLPG